MTQPDDQNEIRPYSIYRPTALQHYLQANEQTVLPPLVRPRTFLFLWLLLALLLAAGGLAWLAPIPIRVTGFAVVAQGDDGLPTLVGFLPPESQRQLKPGQQALVQVNTTGPHRETRVQTVEAKIMNPHDAQARFGLNQAAATLVRQPTAIILAPLPIVPGNLAADALLGAVYDLEVTTGSRPIVSLLPVIGPAFAGRP